MSQVLQEPKSSFIYKDSVEVAKGNPKKRYFKLFLLNNAVTRSISKYGDRFKIQNVDVLNRDIDTFIDRPIIPRYEKNGKHVDPKDKEIYQHRYASKLDYLKAANDYYDDFGRAKIINIYKPDDSLLEAARSNPDTILNYDALCETTDPDLVKLLDEYEKTDKMIYVSPGLVALDSYWTDDGVKVVTQFAATHSHIVDEPAFTEPVAYVHKRTCNKDGKTCYFDLLTASEEKALFNNEQNKNNMSDQAQVGLSQVGEDLNNLNDLNNKDQSGISSKTEISDSKGNVQKTIEKKSEVESPKPKASKKTEGNESGEAEKLEKVEKVEKVEKTEQVKEAPLTESRLLELLAENNKKVLGQVEEKANQKIELERKNTVISKYFDAKNEEVKEDMDFYSSLNLTSEQLSRVLEHSRFNPALNVKGRSSTNTLAGSAYQFNGGIRSSKGVNPINVNDSNKSNGRDSSIHYDNKRGMSGRTTIL